MAEHGVKVIGTVAAEDANWEGTTAASMVQSAEDLKALRDFIPGPDDTLDKMVVMAKYEADGSGDHEILVSYVNNCLALAGTGYAWRKRPQDPWKLGGTREQMLRNLRPMNWNERGARGALKEIKLVDVWERSTLRLQFEDVVFDPSRPCDFQDKNGGWRLNRFRGLKARPKEAGDVDYTKIDLILRHQREVLFKGREELYEFFLDWQADLVRGNPKSGIAIVIIGDQGAGKSAIANFLVDKIIGCDGKYQMARKIDGVDIRTQLLGQFNNDEGMLLTVLEETPSSGGGRNRTGDENKMKALITENYRSTEKKRMDAEMIRDYQRFIFISNNDDCVRIPLGDRRYFVVRAADTYVGNSDYFDALWGQLEDESAAVEYMTMLWRRPGKLQPGKMPKTEEKQEIQEAQRPMISQFAEELVKGEIARAGVMEEIAETMEPTVKLRKNLKLEDLQTAMRLWSGRETLQAFQLKQFATAFQQAYKGRKDVIVVAKKVKIDGAVVWGMRTWCGE